MLRRGFDLETFPTQAAFDAPIPVCATTYDPENGARLWHTWELEECARLVLSGEIVGHNLAFDFSVITEWYPKLRPLIRKAYEEGRVLDTGLAQRIIQIVRGFKGKLGLNIVAREYGFQTEDKEELQDIRLTFGQFYNKHIPEGRHRDYALGDAKLPYELLDRQMATGLVSRRDLKRLAKKAFWQRLVSAQGFRADAKRVEALIKRVDEKYGAMQVVAMQNGLMRPDGSKNMKAIRARMLAAYGDERVPYVDGDPRKSISTAREAFEDSGDPVLLQLSSLGQLSAIRSKDIPLLVEATVHPLHSEFGIADTLRTITKNPNQQNLGKLGGVRECIVPRRDVFVHSDFKNLENFALAALIYRELGLTRMRDKLNRGIDLHAEVAAEILGIPYEAVKFLKAFNKQVSDARNAGKPANYGLSGCMNDPITFQSYARGGYNVFMDLETTIRVMEAWKRTALDQMAWRAYVGCPEGGFEYGDVQIPNSDIIRYGVPATTRGNTPFQALGGEVADEAGWNLLMMQHFDEVLPGRVTLFIHDEFVTDAEKDAVREVARLHDMAMMEACSTVLPEMNMGVDHKALDCYSKEGEGTEWNKVEFVSLKLP